MSRTTAISWADATFNSWIGCSKVSPGCAHCYAQSYGHRFGVEWGPGKPRRRTSSAYWRQPLAWNKQAARQLVGYQNIPDSGKKLYEYRRPRVFCGSLMDWLDPEVPVEWLADLLDLIRRTPNLDWLLLTKRPQLFTDRILAVKWDADSYWHEHFTEGFAEWIRGWTDKSNPTPPANVWLGATVEDQPHADERIPALLAIPAKVRFLSCEPMLGPVDLSLALQGWDVRQTMPDGDPEQFQTEIINFVICGGESGPGCRPMDLAWARSLRDQCAAAGVAFWMKQLGGHPNPRHALADLPEDLPRTPSCTSVPASPRGTDKPLLPAADVRLEQRLLVLAGNRERGQRPLHAVQLRPELVNRQGDMRVSLA